MPIAFRATANNTGSNTFNVTIPGSVQAGDLMLLQASNSAPSGVAGTFTTPSGWTVQHAQQQAGTGVTSVLYRRIATSGDAGTNVSVTNDGGAGVKTEATLVAYSGVDQLSPIHAAATPSASAAVTNSRTTPTVATSVPAWVVEIVSTKNTGSTGWTPPAGTTERADVRGTGSGLVDCGIADSNADVAAGTVGGGTFVNNATPSATGTCVAYTLALLPASSTQTARPVIDVTTAGWTPTPALGVGEAQSARVGEAVRDDATYVESAANPSSSVWETRLQAMADPGVDTGHSVDYVLSTAGGAVSSSVTVAVVQASTVIADWVESDVPDTPTLFTHALLEAEATLITDYADLRLRFTATAA